MHAIMKSLFLIVALVPFLASCGEEEQDDNLLRPRYEVVGLWQACQSLQEGISWDYKTNVHPYYRTHFQFEEDGEFTIFMQEPRLECDSFYVWRKGIYTKSADSLFLSSPEGDIRMKVGQTNAFDAIFMWFDQSENNAIRGKMVFSPAKEIRNNKHMWSPLYDLGARVPSSRQILTPDTIPTGIMVSITRISHSPNERSAYRIWDIKDKSTLVEYIFEEGVNVKRTYDYEVKWDPLDYSDTLILRGKAGEKKFVYEYFGYQLSYQFRANSVSESEEYEEHAFWKINECDFFSPEEAEEVMSRDFKEE